MEKFDLFLFEENFHDGVSTIEEEGSTMSMYEDDDEYTVRIDREMPCMVSTVKTYYADTLTLKTEGDCISCGTAKIGKWKTYDPEGELVDEVDYDEGWKINWEQLQPILIADKIDFKRILNICRVPDKDDVEEPEEESPNTTDTLPDENDTLEEDSEEEVVEELDDYEEEEDGVVEGNDIFADGTDDEGPDITEEPEKPEEYDHVWIVSVLATPKLTIDAIYDGDTGERIGTEFNTSQ